MAGPLQPPDYNLEVDSNCIDIRIYSPLCRPGTMTVTVDGRTLKYDCYPYYLRLTLPDCFVNHVVESFYDELLGYYTLKLIRCQQTLEDIDAAVIYNELVKSIRTSSRIENKMGKSFAKIHYGFLNMYSGKFGSYHVGFSDVIEVEDPDNTTPEMRKKLRELDEDRKWNEYHYIADIIENFSIISLYCFNPFWQTENSRNHLTKFEEDLILKIGMYDCFKNGLQNYQWHFGELQLVDVLLSYCYNKRCTEGSNTVMSAWTITKLSSTLSWFDVFDNLKDLLLTFYRRSITYPLFRNWGFTEKIHSDVVCLLRSGVINLIRALIEIQELFETTGNYYILNMLYVNNMIHFCKYLTVERLRDLAGEIEQITICKTDMKEKLSAYENVAMTGSQESRELNYGIDDDYESDPYYY